MSVKITQNARGEVLAILDEMEQEAEEERNRKWQEEEWYDDESKFLQEPLFRDPDEMIDESPDWDYPQDIYVFDWY